ncbi:MAG: hypothetical protein Q8K82_01640, partial [Gemmatimonadaceae bacterium]|nr:hypothetical protein [Gemmatimonadaceae bacterium]
QSVLTYLNLGNAKLKGMDMGARFILSDRAAMSGTLSLTKLSSVEKKPTDPPAVNEATSLNTTPTKWNVGMDFNSAQFNSLGGFTIRHVTGYNFRSGINAGKIPTFETLDLTFGKRFPSLGAQLNVSFQNIAACSNGAYELLAGQASPGTFRKKRKCNLGQRHLEMINMPTIGTMIFVGVRYER